MRPIPQGFRGVPAVVDLPRVGDLPRVDFTPARRTIRRPRRQTVVRGRPRSIPRPPAER
jgi:hypothetical protein